MFAMLTSALLCSLAQPIRIDLNGDTPRQITVDRETGAYLGHVSTLLLADGRTILAVYPKGHGKGPIVLKRSDDGGQTWSHRLPVPDSWASSLETPTLFRMSRREPDESLILFSGLYPIRAARSTDSGRTWSELQPIGEFGGIVAMGGVADLGEHRSAAFFHDDGRFIAKDGTASGTFTLFQTTTSDAGATWSPPRPIWSGSDVHLCEPGVVRSPDGRTIALLLRENRRTRPSHVMFSHDNAETWSPPRELPMSLTGDRHTAAYAPDGRLVVSYRCMLKDDPWSGDWVAWVGRWDEIAESPAGSAPPAPHDAGRFLVRLKDNLAGWDCGYPGLECLPDGTLVATTYGTWERGEMPYVLSVRFTLSDIERAAKR
jgi:hypothetical protein